MVGQAMADGNKETECYIMPCDLDPHTLVLRLSALCEKKHFPSTDICVICSSAGGKQHIHVHVMTC